MAERIGLEAFFDTSKFKQGFAEYVFGMDKAIFGTNKLSDTMESTATPSTNLANKISDLGNRLIIQQKQLAIANRELEKMVNIDKATATQIERKRLQIDALSNSINKNTRTLGTYRQQVETSQQGLRQFTEEAKETQQSLTRLDVAIGSFAGTTLSGALTGALGAGKDALIGLATEASAAVGAHQQLEASLEALVARELLASGESQNMATALTEASGRAEELGGWLEDLSLRGGTIKQEDIEAAFKLANAYGFSAQESQRLTEALVNFTAGTGQSSDAAQRLSASIGQINSKQRVYAEELQQLQEVGVNTGVVLEKMGLSLADVQSGAVDANKFIETLVSTLEDDFAGAAERQGSTWSGFLARLDKTKTIALREFFESTFEGIQPLANEFVETLGSEEFRAALRESGEQFASLLISSAKFVGLDWKNVGEGLIAATVAAGELFTKLEAVPETRERGLPLINEGINAAQESLEKQGEVWLAIQIRAYAATQQYEKAHALILQNTEATQEFNRVVLEGQPRGASYLEKQEKGLPFIKNLLEQVTQQTTLWDNKLEAIAERGGVLSEKELEKRIDVLENLNEAFEDYGEAQEDINKKAAAASQDYVDKERELQGELGTAYQELNKGRAEAAAELYTGLTEAESDYNRAVIEIGQERLQVGEELSASRLEAEQELNVARAELESDYNRAVAEIGRERLEAEAEINAGRLEAKAEALAALTELEREHSEEVSDINRTLSREIEDYNRERLQAEEDFNRERGELEDDHADKVKRTIDDILDAEDDAADKRFDIQKDLTDRLGDLEDKRKDKLGDIQDDIDDILSRVQVRGLGAEKSLSKEDQKRLADLRKQLADETAEFDQQRQDLNDKAQEALDDAKERSSDKLADLEDKLAQENKAYDDAIAEQQRKFDQQAEDRKLSYDRAVEDLNLRLQRENEGFDRQRGDIQTKLADRNADLQASYDDAIVKLDERQAKERIKLDEQRHVLAGKYVEELNDIQKKHDDALIKLQNRLDQEGIKLNEQRGKLQTAYRDELIDLEASYADRVMAVRSKLTDIAVAHAEKQIELRNQMKDTKEDFEEKIAAIGDAWSGKAMDETQKYVEYLAKFHGYLASTEFPINFKINLPDFMIPGSPSPLELSLMRTEGLLHKLNTTTISPPVLSSPMMSSPAMLPPMIRAGGPSFSNNFGDILLQGGLGSPQEVRNTARQGGLAVESDLATMLLQGAQRQRGNYRSDFGVRT